MIITYEKVDERAKVPKMQYPSDAGYDLYALESVVLQPGDAMVVDTGIAIALPDKCVGMICSRSGLAAADNVIVLNAPGIVDAGYRGTLKVILKNLNNREVSIASNKAIAQLIILELPQGICFSEVNHLSMRDRDKNGLGSTDKGCRTK